MWVNWDPEGRDIFNQDGFFPEALAIVTRNGLGSEISN